MKYLLSLAFSISLLAMAHGQSRLAYYEFGLGAGTLNYSGDIATNNSTEAILKEMRPNFMVFGKRHVNDWFSFGLMASYGWIYASDANHDNQQRGLEVKTSLFQVNPFVEANLIRFGKFHYDRKFTIFVKVGGGFLAYNPQPSAATVYPQDYEVHPNAYRSINYFTGGGMKFRLAYHTVLTLEADFHNSGVDDLDGILSKNAFNQGANDVYGGLYISISRAFF